MEDKYIGLALAVSGSVAIGTSFIITKKGLNDAAKRTDYENASDNLAYLWNPIWWAGMITMVIGEVANFAAYLFAPPILVTPVGSLSVIIGAILASFLLEEELGHLGRLACTLCVIGSLIIVVHAPPDKEVETVDEILHYALQPGFLMYCLTVLVFTLVMIYHVAPKYGRTNPLVYVSICAPVGSVSVMCIKGFGVALKLTFGGNNQFTHPSTYVFGIMVVVCIMVQMNYFNKALDIFSTNVINPMYYVFFSTATLVASLILFQGLDIDDPASTISLLAGFVITFLGVHLLSISRVPEPPLPQNGHSSLESGLMNPRLSISGRISVDGWTGGSVYSNGPRSAHGHHARRGSHYRTASNTVFDAYEAETLGNGHAGGGENVVLHRLREEPEDEEELRRHHNLQQLGHDNEEGDENDDELDADERTRLRSHFEERRTLERQSSGPSPRGTPAPRRS